MRGDRVEVGRKFGRLEVIREIERTKHGHRVWLCRCSCNAAPEVPVVQSAILAESTLSCGCLHKEALRALAKRRSKQHDEAALASPLVWMPENKHDFKVRVGSVIGRLTVIGESDRNKHGHRVWICECACGNKKNHEATQPNLKYGKTQSCGCLLRETTIRRNITHGHAHVGNVSEEYSIWLNMKQRCLNPDSRGFYNYGARGITVCTDWQDSFEAFLRDMGPRPSSKHSIERKNVDGPYSPGNCIWATRREQMANTRRNHYITYRGERVHVVEAARRAGISDKTLRGRMDAGWPEDRWFEAADPARTETITPKTGRPGEVFVDYQGEQMSLNKAATLAGLHRATVRSRIKGGWSEADWFLPPGSKPRSGPNKDTKDRISAAMKDRPLAPAHRTAPSAARWPKKKRV